MALRRGAVIDGMLEAMGSDGLGWRLCKCRAKAKGNEAWQMGIRRLFICTSRVVWPLAPIIGHRKHRVDPEP